MVVWALYVIAGPFSCHQSVLKMFSGPGYLCSEDGVVWPWHSLENFYICLTILSCYVWTPLTLGLIGRDGGFRTLCHSCRFAFQQRLLKTFPGPYYLHSKDGDNLTMAFTGKLYIWLTISYFYDSILFTLALIRRHGGLRTICDSWAVFMSTKGVKNVSWAWISRLQGWGSLTMSFTGKFLYMAH